MISELVGYHNDEESLTTPEKYLSRLFEMSKILIVVENQASEVADLSSVPLIKWDDFSAYSLSISRIETPDEVGISKAVVLRSHTYDFGLVLGNIDKTLEDETRSVFEFGLLSRIGELDYPDTLEVVSGFSQSSNKTEKTLRYLDSIVHSREKSARFFIENGVVKVNYKINENSTIKRQINSPEPGNGLALGGLGESLDLVRQLIRRVQSEYR